VVARLPKETILKVTLLEGRNRQVRNMCDAVGLRIVALKRVSFGPVSVRRLPLGAVRPLQRGELERLDAAAGGSVP
jgi:pseudouridine synthase